MTIATRSYTPPPTGYLLYIKKTIKDLAHFSSFNIGFIQTVNVGLLFIDSFCVW